MSIATINHATQAISRLASQYADKAKLRALLTGIGGVAQNIETALAAIGITLDVAIVLGQQLEICGYLVGASKTLPNGTVLNDTNYRILTRAKIARNSCKGTVPEMLAAFDLIFSHPDVELQDLGWMAMHAQIGRLLSGDEKSMLALSSGDSMVAGAILPKPAGVSLAVSERDTADFFCFSDVADPGVPLMTGGMGFSDVSTPTGTWASLVVTA